MSKSNASAAVARPNKKRFKIYPYLFIAPTFILIFIFSYYAMFDAIVTSLKDSKIGFEGVFNGFENYVRLFQNGVFWISFKNQLVLTVMAVVNSIFWPLLAAELLFFIRHKKVANVIKTAFVIPMLVPGIVTTLTWRFLFNNDFGFNTILEEIGLGSLKHNWLNDESIALWCLIFIGFPFVSGLYFLIFHAGINNIGQELYEAAIIDGATSWQVAWRIHIPNVMPYVNVIATLSLIGSLSGFGLVAATTGGGPGNATMIPAMLMYKVAFGDGNFGYASAMGVVIMIIIMLLTFVTRKLFASKGAD